MSLDGLDFDDPGEDADEPSKAAIEVALWIRANVKGRSILQASMKHLTDAVAGGDRRDSGQERNVPPLGLMAQVIWGCTHSVTMDPAASPTSDLDPSVMRTFVRHLLPATMRPPPLRISPQLGVPAAPASKKRAAAPTDEENKPDGTKNGRSHARKERFV
jgi:hypothetical protein